MSRKFFPVFERRNEPLVSSKIFFNRMVKCGWLAFWLLAVTIGLGAAVYHYVEGMAWVDAMMDAVMVMTGLGLADTLHTVAAKIFTSFYAIATAIVFYGILAIIFAPLLHRFLHSFHLDVDKASDP